MTQNVLAEQEGSKCYFVEHGVNEWNCYYTLEAAKKVCPGESRLPSNADWNYLIEVAGGDSVASKALKSKKWEGKDTYGFNVLPLGAYDGSRESLAGLTQEAFFWSSESLDVVFKSAIDRIKMDRENIEQGDMFSVRCVQGSRMCGAETYDHDLYYCSKEMSIEPLPTCGTALYNPEKSFCYESKKEVRPLCYDSTGKLASYNVTSYFCNEENKIVAYGFCGDYNKAYNPEKEYCDSNSTVQKLKDCGSGDSKKKYNPETHICDSHDGQVYKYVTIGNGAFRRTWMAENLNRETSNSYCYGDQKENCEKYGRLYTWAAAADAGTCPDGWRLPLKEDFEMLFKAVGDSTTAGEKLRSTSGWNGIQGTDSVGFNALPSGGRFISGGYHFGANTEDPGVSFWSSSELSSGRAYSMGMNGGDKKATLNEDGQRDAFSVRCVKGTLPTCLQNGTYDPTKKFCDTRDLHTYKYVTIGSQVWMAENLNYQTKDIDSCYLNNGSKCSDYGRLYTWEAAKIACPVGWHLPTSTDFQTLITYAGGNIAGAISLKATNGWDNNDGTDDFGFAALAAGYRDQASGKYDLEGYDAFFWSSSPLLENVDGCPAGTCAHFMLLRVQNVVESDISVTVGARTAQMSVRCMRD